ncbi:MAG: hypothetical protein ISS56_17810 [Anaerolineae bacterium]|nr:hypothetical protein [Anaerolineae bacterium]
MSEEQTQPLSERELELVRLLSTGLSNKEIGNELYISPNTVKVHLRNIYGKLNVSSRTEATMVAVRMGWVDIGTQDEQPAADQDGPTPELAAPEETRTVLPPLAPWQRATLIASALLVALGLWLIWPGEARQPEPFPDARPQSPRLSLSAASRWQSLAQMPTPRRRLAVVAHRGLIYAIGGSTRSGVSDVVEIYAPDEDDWTRGVDKPTAVESIGAVVLEGRIYVPGGRLDDGQMSDRLEVLEPGEGAQGTWTAAKGLPKGVGAYAIAAQGDALYLFGGYDGSTYLADTYRYSPAGDEWVALSPMPTARAFAGAGTVDGRVYVVGGYDGQVELALCEAYDAAQDRWETCPAMNAPRGGVGVAVVADTLYAIGGGWDSYLVENEYLSPIQGTWKTFPSPVLQEWRDLGVAVNETSFYAIGGWDGEFLGTNQAYRALYRLYLPGTMGGRDSSAE